MKNTRPSVIVFTIFLIFTAIKPIEEHLSPEEYYGTHVKIEDIPEELKTRMHGVSWRPGCPVDLEDLRYITIPYYDFNGHRQTGHLVAHKVVAQELVDIFAEIFIAGEPIARMDTIERFDGDDARSMAANNTSCFCCRQNTTDPTKFSNHSYGFAIDINPVQNPYVRARDNAIYPPEGEKYINRTVFLQGMIDRESVTYRAFTRRGWEWGGNWDLKQTGRTDYQHFEKK